MLDPESASTAVTQNIVFGFFLPSDWSLMCESIPTARMPSPRANPEHLFHEDSRRLGIWQLVSRPPGICKQETCFVTSFRHFRRRSKSRVSSSQTLSFWSRWRAFDHKRPIKAIELFALFFFQSEWLISWPVLCSSIELKQLRLLKCDN